MFEPQSAADIERVELTTDGGAVALSLLRPVDSADTPPVLYWMHGGGMVIGNRHMDDARLIEWCRWLGCVCVSVEYRLAPEAPYPTPLDDCEAGLRYIIEHAEELRVDKHRIGVGGRSAGGGLAAGLALRWCKDADVSLAFQYLEYPMLDDRGLTESSQLDGLPIWSRESNAFGWRSYLGDRYGTDDVPADAAPARATQLGCLPTTFIGVGTVGLLTRRVDRFRRATVPGRRAHRTARLCRRRARVRHVRQHRRDPDSSPRQRGLAGPPVRPTQGHLGGRHSGPGFADATAVIAGGTRGIGLATAVCLAEQGARVGIVGRSEARQVDRYTTEKERHILF